jgi:hypothetical protein
MFDLAMIAMTLVLLASCLGMVAGFDRLSNLD